MIFNEDSVNQLKYIVEDIKGLAAYSSDPYVSSQLWEIVFELNAILKVDRKPYEDKDVSKLQWMRKVEP